MFMNVLPDLTYVYACVDIILCCNVMVHNDQ